MSDSKRSGRSVKYATHETIKNMNLLYSLDSAHCFQIWKNVTAARNFLAKQLFLGAYKSYYLGGVERLEKRWTKCVDYKMKSWDMISPVEE